MKPTENTTNEKLRSFLLPFLGGIFGILSGYLYTLRHENATMALIIGCVIGVVIGSFATKLAVLKVPSFLKELLRREPNVPKRDDGYVDKELALLEKEKRAYHRLLRWTKILCFTLYTIVLTALFAVFYPFFGEEQSIEILTSLFLLYWFFIVLTLILSLIDSSWRLKLTPFSLVKNVLEPATFPEQIAYYQIFTKNKGRYLYEKVPEGTWKILYTGYGLMLLITILATLMILTLAIVIVLTAFFLLYILTEAVFSLLGKRTFWSSLTVSILIVLSIWGRYSTLIETPLAAAMLAFLTGVAAGAIHRFIVSPLSLIVAENLQRGAKALAKDRKTFLGKLQSVAINWVWDIGDQLFERCTSRTVVAD